MGKVRPIEIVFPLMLLVVLMSIHYAIGMSGALMKPDEASRVLRQSGYSEIEITGWRPFSGRDTFSTGFKAMSPSGEAVTGVVTSGWFKGSTVRLD